MQTFPFHTWFQNQDKQRAKIAHRLRVALVPQSSQILCHVQTPSCTIFARGNPIPLWSRNRALVTASHKAVEIREDGGAGSGL